MRPVEIGQLGGDLLRREGRIRQRVDRARLDHVRIHPPQRQQRPPAVDTAVPVEAAEEDRVEIARSARILIARQHMIELVRIFARDVTQRDPRHA